LSYPVSAIAGIGPSMAARLKALGIRTTEKLLEASQSARDRKALAARLDIDEHTVLRWANLADRMRIKGVREPYAELLRDAGVDTVKELKYRNPGRLAEAMTEANLKTRRVQKPPTEKRVQSWIASARKLDPKIRY
jgi:predicted flap endonuclease-1-like 5' DNA nuclease